MDVLIRKAQPADAEAVLKLALELGYEQTIEEMNRKIAAMAASLSDDLIVAVADGRVAGFIHMSVIETIESAPFAEIRGLVVTESLRGQELGKRLVEEGEAWARSRGMDRVRVRSNVVRTRARRFYERLGYVVTKVQNAFDHRLV